MYQIVTKLEYLLQRAQVSKNKNTPICLTLINRKVKRPLYAMVEMSVSDTQDIRYRVRGELVTLGEEYW